MSSNALQGKTTATAQDQLQINKFARLHKTYLEVKRELARMNNDAQNLNDAEDELLLLDEADSASIPIQIGSIFVHYDQETTTEKLEHLKEKTAERIAELERRQTQLDEELNALKVSLYAKFGDNIHLEMESDE